MAPQYFHHPVPKKKFPLTQRAISEIHENRDIGFAINDPLFGEIVDARFAQGVWPEFPAPKADNNAENPGNSSSNPPSTHMGLDSKATSWEQGGLTSAEDYETFYARGSKKDNLPLAFEKDFCERLRQCSPEKRDAFRWYLNQLADENRFTVTTKHKAHFKKLFAPDAEQNTAKQWVRVEKALGAGGFGEVHLYQLRQQVEGEDAQKTNLISQVAVKEAMTDKFFLAYVPEARYTLRANVTGCKNIIKILGWNMMPNDKIKLIYEYCALGSLWDFSKFYWEVSTNQKNKVPLSIPEAFVWHVFNNISNAICYNTYGSNRRKDRPSGWIPIQHRDIKSSNILMTDPDPEVRSLYPNFKLCDYGLAYSLPNEDIIRLKRAGTTGGTHGYMAPENNPDIRSDPKQAPHAREGNAADVYSLGTVIKNLMNISIIWMTDAQQEVVDLKSSYSYMYFPYTRDLVELVSRCMDIDSRRRPGIQELFNKTRHFADEAYRGVVKSAKSPGVRGTYRGMVVWNERMQKSFRNDKEWAEELFQHDWRYIYRKELKRIRTVKLPAAKKHLPRRGYYVVGNGLLRPMTRKQLRRWMSHMNDNRGTDEIFGPIQFLDSRGRFVKRSDSDEVHRFIGFRMLKSVKSNKYWKKTKVELEKMAAANDENE